MPTRKQQKPGAPALDDGEQALVGAIRLALGAPGAIPFSDALVTSKAGVRVWRVLVNDSVVAELDLASGDRSVFVDDDVAAAALELDELAGYLRLLLETAEDGCVQLPPGADEEDAADEDLPTEALQLAAFAALVELCAASLSPSSSSSSSLKAASKAASHLERPFAKRVARLRKQLAA